MRKAEQLAWVRLITISGTLTLFGAALALVERGAGTLFWTGLGIALLGAVGLAVTVAFLDRRQRRLRER